MKIINNNILCHRQIAVATAALLMSTAGLMANDSWQLYDDSQVAVVEITLDPADLIWIYENVHSDSLHPAIVHFTNAWIDSTIDSVGFRLRGNTSRESQKKSFKLSFNTFVPGRQFYGVDKLNLNGEHNDPSIIRSKLSWDFYQDIGVLASRAAHVAVYINGDYYGLYISVEHIDDEFIQKNYSDDSGSLWKCLWPADLTYLGANPDLYKFDSWGRQAYALKTNRQLDDYSQLARLIDIINNSPDEQFAESLETVIVVPEVLKYLAVNTLVGSWDDYRSLMNNYYLYYEPSQQIFHWIPFDYDNTFGIDWFGTDWATANPYDYPLVGDSTPRPLSDRLIANPEYRNLYSHYLEFYRDEIFLQIDWQERMESLKAMISPWAEEDTYRTLDYDFDSNDFNDSYSTAGYENQHVKSSIIGFVTDRSSSLQEMIQWVSSGPGAYSADRWPEIPQPNDSIYITASVFSQAGLDRVDIHFQLGELATIDTITMEFQPVPGTKIVEEADRWQGVIPPLGDTGFGNYYISATDIYGTTVRYPRVGSLLIQTPLIVTDHLLINEFLASNQSVNADVAGEFDDWVELYNPTAQQIILDGMYLTDDPDLPAKWRFPDNDLVLESSGYLLIWCDNDSSQSGLHAFFKLSAAGEYLALVDQDGTTIIDYLSFGAQQTDVSYGRYPDASDNWQPLTPTPGYGNNVLPVDDHAVPPDFKIAVYPNPFNLSTTIDIDLPQPVALSLRVYDLRGREVAVLRQGWLDAGYHNVVWQGKDRSGQAVASGIYFAVLQMENTVRTVKMVLLK